MATVLTEVIKKYMIQKNSVSIWCVHSFVLPCLIQVDQTHAHTN